MLTQKHKGGTRGHPCHVPRTFSEDQVIAPLHLEERWGAEAEAESCSTTSSRKAVQERHGFRGQDAARLGSRAQGPQLHPAKVCACPEQSVGLPESASLHSQAQGQGPPAPGSRCITLQPLCLPGPLLFQILQTIKSLRLGQIRAHILTILLTGGMICDSYLYFLPLGFCNPRRDMEIVFGL